MLTPISVESLKPKASRVEIPDGKIAGLYLTIHPSGRKAWVVRYRHQGKPRKLTLGPYSADGLNLARARALASRRLLEVHAGTDPAAEKQAARRRGATFADVWARYLAEYVQPRLRPKTAYEIEVLGRAQLLPRLGAKPLADVSAADVKAAMRAQIERGAPVQANAVFVLLRQFFNWCRRELLVEASPCSGLRKTEPVRPRERVLSNAEIRRLWHACSAVGWPFGPMVQLLLLTGARRSEVAGMHWVEVSLMARTWTLPPERTKNGRPHVIHLSDPALRIIERLPRIEGSPLVFSTTGRSAPSGFSRVKRTLDKTMGHPPAWVLHDVRRTAASHMAAIGIALPVIERCLNHVSGSFAGVVGVYQKHEFAAEKADAFDRWAAHVVTLCDGS